jgi:hypothetical protein
LLKNNSLKYELNKLDFKEIETGLTKLYSFENKFYQITCQKNIFVLELDLN